MQNFRCRITHLKDRNTAYINFKRHFWDKVKFPNSKRLRPQYLIARVYFFRKTNGDIFMSLKDPVFLPMCKIHGIRRLQCGGRDMTSYKVNLPRRLIKKCNLEKYTIANLCRIKDYDGLLYKCDFTNE